MTTILAEPFVSYYTSIPFLTDYKNHPCIRKCDSHFPRICEYNFTVEYYHTLSKACFDCPFNATDCDRPHCVAADGTRRGIIIVNRMVPGPGIHVSTDINSDIETIDEELSYIMLKAS